MGTAKRYSKEVRERAVRMVVAHQAEPGSRWATIESVAGKLRCAAQTLQRWVTQAERDAVKRAGLTTDERQRLKQLERENFELVKGGDYTLQTVVGAENGAAPHGGRVLLVDTVEGESTSLLIERATGQVRESREI